MTAYTIDIKDESQWNFLLEHFHAKTDHIVFNLNFRRSDVDQFIEDYKDEYVCVFNDEKFHNTFKSIQFRASERLLNFVKSKKRIFWANHYLTNISFFSSGSEIFATISHEDMALIVIECCEETKFLNKGFILHSQM